MLVQVLFSGMYSNGPGAASLTVTVMFVAVEPPELLAQIMNVCVPLVSWVGVPQIVPLFGPKFKPTGPLLVIHQEVMVPPETDGTMGVRGVFTVTTTSEGVYDKDEGACARIPMEKVEEVVPPELVPVTV